MSIYTLSAASAHCPGRTIPREKIPPVNRGRRNNAFFKKPFHQPSGLNLIPISMTPELTPIGRGGRGLDLSTAHRTD